MENKNREMQTKKKTRGVTGGSKMSLPATAGRKIYLFKEKMIESKEMDVEGKK